VASWRLHPLFVPLQPAYIRPPRFPHVALIPLRISRQLRTGLLPRVPGMRSDDIGTHRHMSRKLIWIEQPRFQGFGCSECAWIFNSPPLACRQIFR
jgi:hypothetical protein